MKIKFDHLNYIAENILTLYFNKPSSFDYIAGQYVDLSIPELPSIESDITNWYTLSSSPTEELLAITIRVDKQKSKFKKKLIDLNKGESINMSSPIGDFVLPKNKNVPIVFISGGIGITPVRSMVKYLVDTSSHRNIELTYYVKNKEQLVFDDLFRSYSLKYIPVITSEPDNQYLKHRHTTNNYSENSLFFVSGPQTMVENISDYLAEKYGHNRVVMDYFPGYRTI